MTEPRPAFNEPSGHPSHPSWTKRWGCAAFAGILTVSALVFLWALPPEAVQARVESDLGGELSSVTIPRNHGGGFTFRRLDGSEISLSDGTAIQFRAKHSGPPVVLKDFGRPFEDAVTDYETDRSVWIGASLKSQGSNPPEVHAVLVDLSPTTPYVSKSVSVQLSYMNRVQISWVEVDSEAFLIGLNCSGPRSCDRLVRVTKDRYSVSEFEYPSGTLERILVLRNGRLITASKTGLTWIRPNLGWIAATAELPGASEFKAWSLVSNRVESRLYLEIASGFFSVPVSAGFF